MQPRPRSSLAVVGKAAAERKSAVVAAALGREMRRLEGARYRGRYASVNPPTERIALMAPDIRLATLPAGMSRAAAISLRVRPP